MEWGDFLNLLHDLSELAERKHVTITLTVNAEQTEINIEPFQPVAQIVNHGSDIYYIFDEEENDGGKDS